MSPPGPTSNRSGFTLIEVLVALTLGALVVLGARAMLVQVGDTARQIIEAGRQNDEAANADRLLRALLLNVAQNDGAADRFDGDGSSARFVSWCQTPGGWLERCSVTLRLESPGGSGRLTAQVPGRAAVVLRSGFSDGALRYLHSARDGGTWLASWNSALLTPAAVALVLDGDTVILRIGERG